MILITVTDKDGNECETYPSKGNDVVAATDKFLSFCDETPMVILGKKTAKIRRVIEMEEISEITLPEPNVDNLMKNLSMLIDRL